MPIPDLQPPGNIGRIYLFYFVDILHQSDHMVLYLDDMHIFVQESVEVSVDCAPMSSW